MEQRMGNKQSSKSPVLTIKRHWSSFAPAECDRPDTGIRQGGQKVNEKQVIGA
jgi:hypothetical protein